MAAKIPKSMYPPIGQPRPARQPRPLVESEAQRKQRKEDEAHRRSVLQRLSKKRVRYLDV